eukprot:scaffold24476_cov36-Prasinocladus_malaysianus.AAC.1
MPPGRRPGSDARNDCRWLFDAAFGLQDSPGGHLAGQAAAGAGGHGEVRVGDGEDFQPHGLWQCIGAWAGLHSRYKIAKSWLKSTAGDIDLGLLDSRRQTGLTD